MSDKHDKHEGT